MDEQDNSRRGSAGDDYADRLADVGSATLTAIASMEAVARRLHPPQMNALRGRVAPVAERLETALDAYRTTHAPDGLEAFHADVVRAAELALMSLEMFCEKVDPAGAVAQVLAALRANCRAQEAVYRMHAFPPFGQFFLEKGARDSPVDASTLVQRSADVGLFSGGGASEPGGTAGTEETSAGARASGRGGFTLYVPECYDGSQQRPLVVALHGGSGDGRDFVWTWLREARSRNFLLLCPTSQGSTWPLMGEDIDDPASDAAFILETVERICARWKVDREHMLLTGLSDGATYTYLLGLRKSSPFTALCAVSGVFSPANFRTDNVGRAAGRRIYIAHGALDWLFPPQLARMARDLLVEAGAEVEYREIADLSHTYPREENDRILTWFDPSLALPGAAPAP